MAANKWMKKWFPICVIAATGLMPHVTWAQEIPEAALAPREILIFARRHPDDDRLLTLAGAFGARALVRVVAPFFEADASFDQEDASGLPRTIRTRKVFELANIIAHEVSGAGARWMRFTLEDLLRESPPDLVIAGFDDPPNATNGTSHWAERAAGTAAELGIPAIAVVPPISAGSESVIEMARWLVSLCDQPWLEDLTGSGYLRVQFPRKGSVGPWPIRVGATSDIGHDTGYKPVWEESNEGWRVWTREPEALPALFTENGTRASRQVDPCILLTPIKISQPDVRLIQTLQISPLESLPIPASLNRH